MLRDFKFALRVLAKSPGFALVAVLSLAIGIGINSALFSLVNSILLRPLPAISEPDQLVRLFTEEPETTGPSGVSYQEYLDIRRQQDVFTELAAHFPIFLGLATNEKPELAFTYLATEDYFSVLGVQPAMGRTFGSDELRSPVAVLSHGFWQRRFGEDPTIVGAAVRLNGQPFTVIGVAPPGFIGTEAVLAPDLWIPMEMDPLVRSGSALLRDRQERFLRCTARLAPAVDFDQARLEMAAVGESMARQHPVASRGVTLGIVPESEARIEVGAGATLSQAAILLLALVGLVLLIACGNVAGLLVSRAAGRRQEIGIRLALGSPRGRLIWQLLMEGFVLAILGGFVGLLLAYGVGHYLESFAAPLDLPLALDLAPDGRVILYTFFLALVSTLVFGLVPALQATRTDLVGILRGDFGGGGAFGRRWTAPRLLVVAQVAFCLVVLNSAGLFLRSLDRSSAIDTGIEAEGVLAMTLDTQMRGYSEDEGRELFRQLTSRLGAMPGVETVGFADPVPMGFSTSETRVARVGESLEESPATLFSIVGGSYFEAVRTPILEGRAFEDRDDENGQPAVIVNATLAQRLWPGQEALGRQLQVAAAGDEPRTVIGVAKNGSYRFPGESPRPFLYLPDTQVFTPTATLVLRSRDDPRNHLSATLRIIHELDPDLVVVGAQPLEELISSRALMPMRTLATLTGAFGSLAALLAFIGLYGLLTYWVTRRLRAIGIQRALGAQTHQVIRQVVSQGMVLTAIGLGVGLLLAWVSSQLLAGLLIGVDPLDPLTLVVVPALLLIATLAASVIPARRASRIQPSSLLRQT